ncbi:MAG: TolC family protein [Planctomycetes bacterium]|nr:TolC family protein [Planctomycetota bacterium]
MSEIRGRCPLAGVVGLLVGCASVEPGADYRQAGDLIRHRVGSGEVYDPQADALVEDKVDALLVDGLTIDEAVQVALLNNRGLQGAFLDIGVSRAEVVQSGLLANPTASFLAKLPEGGGRAHVEFELAQELVDLWQIPVRKKIAEAQLEVTVLEVARQAIELAADIRAACYRVVTLEQSEATVRENLQLVEQSEDLARRRFEAGEASQLDVNLARSNTIDVRLELLQLERERRLAEAALARLLNLSEAGRQPVLRDALPEIQAPADEDALLGLAMTQRLDARAAEFRVRAAENQVQQEWLKVFPSVSAGIALERSERRALPGRNVLADTARDSIAAGGLTAPTIESRAQRRAERRQEIDAILGPSFSATLPIWDQNQAQIAKARYQAEQRRKEYEDLVDGIANQVGQAATSLRSARQIVQFYRDEALPQSNQNLDGARRLYQAGEQGIIVVIEAQESLVARRRAYVSALGEYAAAMAELERAIGGRLSE